MPGYYIGIWGFWDGCSTGVWGIFGCSTEFFPLEPKLIVKLPSPVTYNDLLIIVSIKSVPASDWEK